MITFDHVTISYADAPRPVLTDASFTIGEGDLCLVIGRTGTGKSTLLGAINGLVPHFTGGTLTGDVTVAGRLTRTHRPRDMADLVGYVGQNPLAGFVTDMVEDEIAYGMEQLGLSPLAMRKRVEESLDLVGLADLRRRPLIELSGGQQQRVAIASVLAAQPRVLVLDEPTSALDPTAAQEVLAAITTLVHEVGLTVVLAEHRLERVMASADSVLWLPGDGRAELGPTSQILDSANVVPPLAKLARSLGWRDLPTSVRAARRRVASERVEVSVVEPPTRRAGETLVSTRDLTVRYGEVVAVRSLDLSLRAGEVTAIMGRNGAGKSTLLWALQGALPSSGDLTVAGRDPRTITADAARRVVSLVPQQAADLLYLPTVGEELAQGDAESKAEPGSCAAVLAELGAALDLDQHPRDLSEGQRLALVLAIQLVAGPRVILLDEPTRGLDYTMKDELAALVRALADAGNAVAISTHDVEFTALATDRTIVMAEGEIVADGTTREVCTSSPVNSPQVAKVFHPLSVLTTRDLTVASRV